MAEESCSGFSTAETNADGGEIRGTNIEEGGHQIGDSEETQVYPTDLILTYLGFLV